MAVSETSRPRRRTTVLASIVASVVLLALAAGTGVLDRQADVSVRARSAAGGEVLVDIGNVHPGRNAVHVHVRDASGQLTAARWLRLSGRRREPAASMPAMPDMPAMPVLAGVALDPAGVGHFIGSIDLAKGHWLLTVVGVDAADRPIEATFDVGVS